MLFQDDSEVIKHLQEIESEDEEKDLSDQPVVFLPTKKRMKAEYPELSVVEEFLQLNDNQLRFAWYMGCVSSPIYTQKNKSLKTGTAISLSGMEKYISKEDMSKWINGQIPPEIEAAINKFETYIPSIRATAKSIQEIILDNFLKIASKKVEKMDAEEKAVYVNMASKISADVPKIVSEVENAYAIKIQKHVKSKKISFMDRVIEEQSK